MIDEGFSLITVGDSKRPNLKWKEQQTRQLSKEEFERNYSLDSTKGIGYCTGFNNLEVFDIDLKILPTLKAQTDWWEEYHAFLKDNIADFDDKFVIYKTVNNGYHIIYRCAEIGGNQKIAKLRNYTEAIIETRGVGGYCFIYDKQVSKLDYYNIQEISTKDREVLFECSRFYNYVEETKPIEVPKSEEKKSFSDGLKPWEDYNEKVGALDLIQDEFSIVRQLKTQYIIKRHGAESAHSGYVYMDSRCMYLFSTGTRYPHEELLTPFHIYTIKYHNGDFSSAAKQLYREGYGERYVPEIEITPAEELVNFEPSELDFPLEIFPKDLADYIRVCNSTMGSSVDYMGCSLLWMTAVIIGNSLELKVTSKFKANCNIWIALVGKQGVGKTPSVNNIISPLKKVNLREIKRYLKAYEKFEAYTELSKEEKKHAEKITEPTQSQFIADDITLEALAQMHEQSKNAVGIFRDELAGWVNDMTRYRSGSDMERWLSCFSGESLILNRKTSKNSVIEKPCIPILGGIQPAILEKIFTPENSENGFSHRLLISNPDLKIEKVNENEMDEAIEEWYESFVIDFYEAVKKDIVKYNIEDEIEPQRVVWSKEAKEEWIRIDSELVEIDRADDVLEFIKSMVPKQRIYLPKFALLLNSLHSFFDSEAVNTFEISRESILAAEKLVKYFMNHAGKLKVENKYLKEAKDLLDESPKISNKKKSFLLFAKFPDLKQSEIAKQLGVTERSIRNYYKEFKSNEEK